MHGFGLFIGEAAIDFDKHGGDVEQTGGQRFVEGLQAAGGTEFGVEIGGEVDGIIGFRLLPIFEGDAVHDDESGVFEVFERGFDVCAFNAE